MDFLGGALQVLLGLSAAPWAVCNVLNWLRSLSDHRQHLEAYWFDVSEENQG